MAALDESSGLPTATPAGDDSRPLTLELSLAEARALRSWLLKPLGDGSTALDDNLVKAATVRLGTELDFIEAVDSVREELEAAGFQTEDMSDQEIAELSRRISQASSQRLRNV